MKLLLSGCLASIAIFAQRQPPAFRSDAVANAASYASFPGICPGELVSIFGSNFGLDVRLAAEVDPDTGKLPVALGGVVVTFDGIPAPLLFVSQSQINLQVPYEIAGRPSTTVVVRFGGLASRPASVPVFRVQPGIFTVDVQPGVFSESSSAQAVVLNQDGSRNHAENPAVMGSIVTIFAAGLGEVLPAAETGVLAPEERQFVVDDFDLVIGGVRAVVHFAGLVPGQVGLYQIDASVPFVPVPSAVTPLRIVSGSATSQRNVTIAVR